MEVIGFEGGAAEGHLGLHEHAVTTDEVVKASCFRREVRQDERRATTMTKFSEEIDRLTAKLAGAVGSSGRTMAKALPGAGRVQPRTITGEQFMAKAMTAQAAGLLSSAEISELEGAIACGRQPRAELVKAVVLETPIGLRGEHTVTFERLHANLGNAVAPMAKAEPTVIRTDAPAGRLAPSEREVVGGMSADQFMIKAADAQQKGVITSTELAELEQFCNSGKQPPAKLVRAVLSGEEVPAWQR